MLLLLLQSRQATGDVTRHQPHALRAGPLQTRLGNAPGKGKQRRPRQGEEQRRANAKAARANNAHALSTKKDVNWPTIRPPARSCEGLGMRKEILLFSLKRH